MAVPSGYQDAPRPAPTLGRFLWHCLAGRTQVPLSYLNVQPNWRPLLTRDDGTFDMAALIRFAMQP
ncbi:MAG: hypothetical protein ACRDRP_12460 [Pseudonocardiaceae bacterium]